MKEQHIFREDQLKRTLLEEIKQVWNNVPDEAPNFLDIQDKSAQEKNEKRIMKTVDKINRQLEAFPYLFRQCFKRKKWKRETEELLYKTMLEEPLLNMEKAMSAGSFNSFANETKEFLRRVIKFDKDMQIDDMGQALRNYMVYAIFLEQNGMRQRCKPSIFGYSMLYPYTDNYIDNQSIPEAEKAHYNQFIADKLKGTVCKPMSLHEEKTEKLLAGIEEDYGRPDEIYDGLLYMLEAQRNSLRQPDKKEDLREEEILNISVYKGGLSVLIDRYFIDKKFSGKDLFFYYGFGFILQLCDDLQDIRQDKEEGSRTVFTICREKEEIDKKVNRLLHLTKNIFAAGIGSRIEFNDFLLRNTYLLILFSAAGSSEYMTEEWLTWAECRLPVSPGFLAGMKKDRAGMQDMENTRGFNKMLRTLLKK